MRIQLLSDLHLESESFDPEPAPGAELLVLAGDIDSSWQAYERFAGWPVPVLVVAGNHEFDFRDLHDAWPRLRDHCERLGLTLLEREGLVFDGADSRQVRFLGSVRWSDFDVFGDAGRERALRAGAYFQRVMQATRGGEVFDADAVREEGLACRAWLAAELRAELGTEPRAAAPAAAATVVVTHFAPSLRSADPRYGPVPGSASFCNNDESLMPAVDLWLHGHVHCRHDYRLQHADGRSTRVVCQSRGLDHKGESVGFDALKILEV